LECDVRETQSLLSAWRGRRVLIVLCTVAFMDFVDASITNVALPHIRAALGFSQQTLQWVPSGYLLTYGGLMLLGGRLADLFGRRRVMLTGTALVGLASLAGGLAQSSEVFVGPRLLQGAGGQGFPPGNHLPQSGFGDLIGPDDPSNHAASPSTTPWSCRLPSPGRTLQHPPNRPRRNAL
jgi:sugar phosphate permease